jgi:HEAT repeats
MQKETKPPQDEALSPEIQDIMRNLFTAIRVTKLYPSNNPIYSQSVEKSFDGLAQFLETSREYRVGVQKTNFTYLHTPVGKDAQLNRAIAQDLFTKGIREMVFSNGMTAAELLSFCQTLALTPEELAMKNGITSILWEKGITNIKVTEAGLDDVITTQAEGKREDKNGVAAGANAEERETAAGQNQPTSPTRTLALEDVMADPVGFASRMLALAIQTRAEHETVEDRLFSLYQEAGRKIRAEHPGESDALFDALAKSVLALPSPHREALIAGKLYGDLDAEMASEQESEADVQLPNALHEIQTGRFSGDWNAQQISTLLKRTSAKKIEKPAPLSPANLAVTPIPEDLAAIAKDLAEYSPEQMESLKVLGNAGMESDIIDAAVHTLTSLLPLAKDPLHADPTEREIDLFSGVVGQLEDMLGYLLQKKKYGPATVIIKALHTPLDPKFKPRINEALKKTLTKDIVVSTVEDMRRHPRTSPEYQAAYAYLAALDWKATGFLLELLAEEQDRHVRLFILELLKDFGKNQISLLGDYLSDDRWYVVRNIVSILAENKTDQAIVYLRKAADHKNMQIQQEVIKALLSTGGKKAASVLPKFLREQDAGIQMAAIRAYADFPGIAAEEAAPLIEYLGSRPFRKKDRELLLETFKTLGRIGGLDAVEFLKGYARIRWWRPRKPQAEIREAASRAIEEIRKGKRDVDRVR